MLGPLGRNKPPDFDHVAKYPITALPPEARPVHVPVAIGVHWFTSFDEPQPGADGKNRISITPGATVRGGHCVCLEPAVATERDAPTYWEFYNQGAEGACEGFGHSRALSLIYRRTFDAFWLYDDGRRIEGTFPEGEGSTNRAICSALVKWGAHYETGSECVRTPWHLHAPGLGIAAYRWATTASEVFAALGATGEEVALLNSWGTAYPERVYLSGETLERLLQEEGEADIFTLR